MPAEHLSGLTEPEIQRLIKDFKQPAYRARQLAEWLYVKKVNSIDAMSNLPASLRSALRERFSVGRIPPEKVAESPDGTRKYLFQTPAGFFIETAVIPDGDRRTICLSTQAGCKMGCTFCATGAQGFLGNLSASDMLNQYLALPERDRITNFVFMGMGEPFDNYDALKTVLELLTADYAMAMSPSRITVSTVGIIPSMKRYLADFRCHLAISVHSANPIQRAAMMPVERKYPIAQVIHELRSASFTQHRRLTIEYAMINGSNDSPQHAIDLARLLSGLRCRVNLIPCNAWDGSACTASNRSTILAFQDILQQRGFITTLRKSKGQDIAAACGLLSTVQSSPTKQD